jgi:hypothetical protein
VYQVNTSASTDIGQFARCSAICVDGVLEPRFTGVNVSHGSAIDHGIRIVSRNYALSRFPVTNIEFHCRYFEIRRGGMKRPGDGPVSVAGFKHNVATD